jgi:hypothetical protein
LGLSLAALAALLETAKSNKIHTGLNILVITLPSRSFTLTVSQLHLFLSHGTSRAFDAAAAVRKVIYY